jgi:AcrR family transcriptional regulator
MPLFARKGFAATTVKDIAEVAGVSEALLYKHFRSKNDLYQAILAHGHSEDNPLVVWIRGLAPSTNSLVLMVKMFVRFSVCPPVEAEAPMEARSRLIMNSLLDDGEFAQIVTDSVVDFSSPYFADCLSSALEAGDAVPVDITAGDLAWCVYQLATMAGFFRLAKRASLPHGDDPDAWVCQLASFLLRGMGLTDRAISAHINTPLPKFAPSAADCCKDVA